MASDERVILGNVIGGIPNTIPYLLQHLTRLAPENDSNGSRAGIAPGAPIHEQRTIAIPTLESMLPVSEEITSPESAATIDTLLQADPPASAKTTSTPLSSRVSRNPWLHARSAH